MPLWSENFASIKLNRCVAKELCNLSNNLHLPGNGYKSLELNVVRCLNQKQIDTTMRWKILRGISVHIVILTEAFMAKLAIVSTFKHNWIHLNTLNQSSKILQSQFLAHTSWNHCRLNSSFRTTVGFRIEDDKFLTRCFKTICPEQWPVKCFSAELSPQVIRIQHNYAQQKYICFNIRSPLTSLNF